MYFSIFGCLVYVLVRKKDCKVLEPRSCKCIFVDYPEGTMACQLWDPAAKRFIIWLHGVFDKRCEEHERWLRAAQDEIQFLVENRTFELVQLPPRRNLDRPFVSRATHMAPLGDVLEC